MEKILVSACLLGEKCKYSGGSNDSGAVCGLLERMRGKAEAIPVCPEVLGGLPTPRTPAEIREHTVMTEDGRDVTAEYREGARRALELAKERGCRYAILKERSPSCGSGAIYDGTFSHTVIPGDGVTAKLLKEHGIEVYGETHTEEIEKRLCGLGQ